MKNQPGITTANPIRTPYVLHVGVAEKDVMRALRAVMPHGQVSGDSWHTWDEKAAEALPGPGGDEGEPWHLRINLFARPGRYLTQLRRAGVDLAPMKYEGDPVAVVTDAETEEEVQEMWDALEVAYGAGGADTSHWH